MAVKNGTLSILSPQLQTIGEFGGLNFPYSVTGVEAFPIDIDDDGNLGEVEDNDGDAITSQQETFDLAFVSTSDGLVIVDVTDPGTPKKMALIPMTSPGRVVVNRAKRLAYVSVGNDLYAISLRNPSGIGLIDKDKDGRDDRIVAIKPGYGFIDAVIEMDDLGRELLYLANYTDGQMRVVDLNLPRIDGKVLVRVQTKGKAGWDKWAWKDGGSIFGDDTAEFRATAEGGCNFVYNWDFGDGHTAITKEPIHLYYWTDHFVVGMDVKCQANNPSAKSKKMDLTVGFVVTCYKRADENECNGNVLTNPYGLQGDFCEGFLKDAKLQGSGITSDGNLMQIDWSRTKCKNNKCNPLYFEVVDVIKTASGNPLTANMSLAVDPSIIPVPPGGTIVYIDTIGYRRADDTGVGRIHGYHVDLFGGFGENACYRWPNPILPIEDY